MKEEGRSRKKKEDGKKAEEGRRKKQKKGKTEKRKEKQKEKEKGKEKKRARPRLPALVKFIWARGGLWRGRLNRRWCPEAPFWNPLCHRGGPSGPPSCHVWVPLRQQWCPEAPLSPKFKC